MVLIRLASSYALSQRIIQYHLSTGSLNKGFWISIFTMSDLPSGRTTRKSRLVLTELIDEGTKAIGENVFIDNIPEGYEVYLFYYPSFMPNEQLEKKLRNFGKITGKNLFVNIGRLNDPKYRKMKKTFDIVNLPVVIVTGIEGLASIKTERYSSTAYVKIDSEHLLNSPDLTIRSLERLFNLFIGGEIAEAMKQVTTDQRNAIVSNLKRVTVKALKEIANFLSDKDISVSLIEGKFELKHI